MRNIALGSDPNNPGSFSPRAPAAVASNCAVVVDSFVFVFIFGPTHTPRPFPPRRAEEGANTTFGRVYKRRKYTCHGALRPTNQIFLFPTCLSNVYFFSLNARPNRAVGSLSRPAGRERAGGESGAKKRKNRSLTFNSPNGRTTMCLDHLPRGIMPEGVHA